MSENRVKRILESGAVALGACIHVPATAHVDIVGRAGFDFVMIDAEHGMFGMTTAGELIRVARALNVTPIIRVLQSEPEIIMKALDLGAQGVVIPHVASREDAVRAVAACRYGPDGRRGACPIVAAADYNLGDWKTFQRRANEETLVLALIEEMAGVENIEEIASVDGVDVIFLGPFDLSVSSGYEGNVEHPQIKQALDHVLEVARKHQKPTMIAAGTSGGDIGAWIEKGVRMVMQSADSLVFSRACREFLTEHEHLRKV